jgi:hypothetical protein
MGRGHDRNNPILRGFQSQISGMFLYGRRPAGEATLTNGGGTNEVAPLAADKNHTFLHHRKFRGQRTCVQRPAHSMRSFPRTTGISHSSSAPGGAE